jgi:ER-bound oxygenase mpaB/B'/Rubber oxygenase, catalytic domain
MTTVGDDALAQAQLQADPLADTTIARILGPWRTARAGAIADEALACNAAHWQHLAQVNRLLAQWTDNGGLVAWRAQDTAPDIAQALQAYLQVAQALPDWAEPALIARAEALFMDYGALSCILLFCASLPECYVVPDLSAVLHAAGQLEAHTEYRIRATAAMIFPVMLHGGLTSAQGSGIAQVLKVRLIHATIRNLILHGDPQDAAQTRMAVAPTPSLWDSQRLHEALFAHGWNTTTQGLPCNQEELAYTLLTFGYVFLRSLRRLGLGLSPEDERAYLHAWNVMGHVLGIERRYMADTMGEAEALFARMQARGRASPVAPDPRPGLGQALMHAMEHAIPLRAAKAFPVLMTRHLCGGQAMRELGIDRRVPWLAHALFALGMGITRGIDAVVRLALPEFSITRCITRIFGYHFMARILMDQTRPLKLPAALLEHVGRTMDSWSDDPRAPRWLNALEDRFTTRGLWRSAARH